MVKLTGCILAKNEESNMEGCMGCLSALTDQLILVDNGSTDRTKEIAMNYGAKIIESKDTYIDEARNLYLKEAKTEWVLILDADERIDVKFKDEIYQNSFLSSYSNIFDLYIYCYKSLGDNKKADEYKKLKWSLTRAENKTCVD